MAIVRWSYIVRMYYEIECDLVPFTKFEYWYIFII